MNASSAIHSDQLNNPAIVWWYFKSALWCWNTSKDYFDNTTQLLEKQDQNLLPSLSEEAVRREIVAVKSGKNLEHQPVIFAEEFFLRIRNPILSILSNLIVIKILYRRRPV